MKKLVTIFLAIAMLFAMCIPAFAADTANLTINGLAGRTYVGYKLLDLTTSHKAGVNCGGNHEPNTCYNYSYTVTDDYRAILQNEVFANGEPTAAAATEITDDEIIKYLADKSSGKYDGTMRAVADRLYVAIKNAGIDAEQTTFEGNATVEQGYWLFADVTNLEGQEAANSFVMVDTKGEENLTITPKTGLPTITKEVYDVNDTTTANAWGDSADHDITDDVQFRLTATLAENFEYYDTYKLIFHDDLADGLTLDASSVAVTANNAGVTVDISDKYTVNHAPQDADCDFEVIFNDVTDITNVTKDTVFVVTYTAKLNENAIVGTQGNPNKVTLEFSNDPYSNSTGETSDNVKVYTYELVIDKIDAVTKAGLDGAEFTLSKKNEQGGYDVVDTVVLSNNDATFTWTGIDDGEYKLEETVAPAGYNKLTAPIEFTVSATHTNESLALSSTWGDVVDGTISEEIENSTGTILPETGAMGTMLFIFGGSMLVVMAAVFMITRKKMSVYED